MNETLLLLEGVPPDEITVAFLVDVMDIGERHGFPVDGISVFQDGDGKDVFIDRPP